MISNLKNCPYCSRAIVVDTIKCPHCAKFVVHDRRVLLKIVEDFEAHVDTREDPQKIGILLGIPESKLPHKKETIEQALEFFMLAYAVEFLRTKSHEAEAKFNAYEIQFLTLAEYFPDKDMLFYDIAVSNENEQSRNDKIRGLLSSEKGVRDFERWTKVMYDSEERYYEKVKEIKAMAQEISQKVITSKE